MSTSLKTKSLLLADHGLFAELGPRLAREFGEVKYFMPWISAYPRAVMDHVGVGLEGVKHVSSFWDHVADADVVMFPDLYFADVLRVVRDKFGKPVWGHGAAECLELDRKDTRKLQAELGIPAPKTKTVVGVEALADFLQKHDDLYVKISTYRGDMETFHHETWHTTRVFLDQFCHRVGALADEYKFLIEDAVEGVEVGFDGWTVNGEWPRACYWGLEIKDRAYVGQFSAYDGMPEPVKFVNDKVVPVLKEKGAVGFCSFELRYNEDKRAYLIDPCMRCGSPPTEGTMEAYDNLGQIIWEGAHGRMAAAVPLARYLAVAMMDCPLALTSWVPIEIPDDIRRWVKLRNPVVLDGEYYHAPTGGDSPEIGAVVGVAANLEDACELVRERATRIKALGLRIFLEALGEANAQIERASEYGIKF